jgi:hypothetical protein
MSAPFLFDPDTDKGNRQNDPYSNIRKKPDTGLHWEHVRSNLSRGS